MRNISSFGFEMGGRGGIRLRVESAMVYSFPFLSERYSEARERNIEMGGTANAVWSGCYAMLRYRSLFY
jgi:hypothetical protein